jgi:hypothetical protein
MYNYPVIECLIAFAIVFFIGFLVADRGRQGEPAAPTIEVVRP